MFLANTQTLFRRHSKKETILSIAVVYEHKILNHPISAQFSPNRPKRAQTCLFMPFHAQTCPNVPKREMMFLTCSNLAERLMKQPI